jgi:hypothetical protein
MKTITAVAAVAAGAVLWGVLRSSSKSPSTPQTPQSPQTPRLPSSPSSPSSPDFVGPPEPIAGGMGPPLPIPSLYGPWADQVYTPSPEENADDLIEWLNDSEPAW